MREWRERSKRIGRKRERKGTEKQKGRFSRHSDGRRSTVQEEKSIHKRGLRVGTKIFEFHQTP